MEINLLKISFVFILKFLNFNVYFCYAKMYICILCMPGAFRGQKGALSFESGKLKLPTFIIHLAS